MPSTISSSSSGSPPLEASLSHTLAPIPMYVTHKQNDNISSSPSWQLTNISRWDSSDPARSPAPLPRNPHPSSPSVKPLALTFGNTSPTKQPQTPLGTVQKRLNSLQTPVTSSVRGLSAAFEGQNTTKQPTGLHNPQTSGSTLKDSAMNILSASKKIEKVDVHTRLPPPQPNFRPVLDTQNQHTARMSTNPGTTASPLLSSSQIGGDRFTTAINAGDFQVLTSHLTNILNISTTLQKEMSSLSRRSKDNATDLLSLKEATHSRDEDIRASLKDLVNGLGAEQMLAPSTRLAITAGANETDKPLEGKALMRYNDPNLHRNFMNDAEEVLRENRERRKSLSREYQNNLEQQNMDKILRSMAKKDVQDRILEIVKQVQDEVSEQGKTVLKSLADMITNIQEISSPNNAIIRFREKDEQPDDNEVLELLRNLKEGLKDQVKDVHSTLLSLNNGTSSRFDHIQTTVSKIDQTSEEHFQQGEDIKNLICKFQDDLTQKERAVGERLQAICQKIHELPTFVANGDQASLSGPNTGLNSYDKAMLDNMRNNIVQQVESQGERTSNALKTTLSEIHKVLSSHCQSGENGQSTFMNQQFQTVRQDIHHVLDSISGGEKITEKALEIILREMAKITPNLENLLSNMTQHAGIEPALAMVVRKETEALSGAVTQVKHSVDDAVTSILSEIEKLGHIPFQSLVKARDGDHHFDGSVAAVSAIGAMAKDLKHSVQNLQSDVNGREEVTEKALEIILREIGTINKAVASIPKSVQNTSHVHEDLDRFTRHLQQEISAKEKHTEKAMEIILREVGVVSAALGKLQPGTTSQSRANSPAPSEKDMRFSLETLLTRSSRTADNSAAILELLETFHTSSTGTTQATYSLLQAVDRAIKEPILSTNSLVSALQEQFVSANSNTGKSLVEVAKFLDDLGGNTNTMLLRTDGTMSHLDSLKTDVLELKSTFTDKNELLLKQFAELHNEIKDNHNKALSVIPEHPEIEMLEELTRQHEASYVDLKSVVENSRQILETNVLAQEKGFQNCVSVLEQHNHTYKQTTMEMNDNVRVVKDVVNGLGSDSGALAKTLVAIKDIGSSLENIEKFVSLELSSNPKGQLNDIVEHLTNLQNHLTAFEQAIKQDVQDTTSKHSRNLEQLLINFDTLQQVTKVLESDKLPSEVTQTLQTVMGLGVEEKHKEIVERLEKLQIELSITKTSNYEDEVREKLESLLNHSTHQAQVLSQMPLLDQMHKQVTESSSKVDKFMESQTALLQINAANEKHAAAEATLALERAMSEKSFIDRSIASLKDEETLVEKSVKVLHEEQELLITQNQRLKSELSSMEAAIAVRREELNLLENRAEALERRVLEGVMTQSRSLLLAKSSKDKKKPLQKIPNPPASGTIRSKKGNTGRRILSLNQMDASQQPPLQTYMTRTPSSGSNLLKHLPARESMNATFKRSPSMRSGKSEAARRASWVTGVFEDKENEDNAEDLQDREDEPREQPDIVIVEADEDQLDDSLNSTGGISKHAGSNLAVLNGADEMLLEMDQDACASDFTIHEDERTPEACEAQTEVPLDEHQDLGGDLVIIPPLLPPGVSNDDEEEIELD